MTKAQLQTTLEEFKGAQAKLMEQESTLKELQERVTQDLAKASRDRENIRSELFRALEAVKHQNSSCEQCPPSWLPFQGSCYYFSETQAIWNTAQNYCGGQGAHLVIVRDLNEQVLSWDLGKEKLGLPELVWPRMFGRLGQLMCPPPSRAS